MGRSIPVSPDLVRVGRVAQTLVATFSVDDEGTIYFGQTLMGQFVHDEELRRTVRAVALTANCLDEIIAERTSGMRSIDVKAWLRGV